MAKLSGNNNQSIGIISDFFGQSPYPNYIKGADYKFLSVSKSLVDYFSAEAPENFVGKDFSALIKDEKVSALYDDFDKEIPEGTDTIDRVLPSYVDKDGIQRYVRVSKTVLKDSDNNVVGVIGNLFDYTMTHDAKVRFDRQAQNYLKLPNKAFCCAFIDATEWKMLDFTIVEDNHLVHLNISVSEFLAKSDRAISSDSNAHRFFTDFGRSEVLKKFNAGDTGSSIEFLIENDDSTSFWVKFEYFFIVNPENDHVCILLSVLDVSAQRTEMDNLIKAAEQDSMTELLNHESAMTKIRQYIQMESRNNLNALFIIDIDNFKEINDTFGHRTGDTVIIEFAQRISASFRESDIVGRIGGDEFLVLMKDIDSVWTATNKAAELINTLQYECRREGRSIFLTSSIGVALFSENVNLEDLYSEADEALYKAKNSGKNKYILNENGDFSSFDSTSKVADIAVDLKTVLSGIDGIMFIAEIEDDDIRILYSSNSHYNQMIIEQMPADEYSRLLYAIKKAHELEIPLDYTSPKPLVFRNKSRWLHIKGNFLESDKPRTIKLSLIVTDVFSFKNTQQQLEIQNTKNNLALSITNLLIWEYDLQTRFITLHNSEEKSIPYWGKDMCFSQSNDDYIALYSKIDEGEKEGSSFIHFKNFFGYQTWMQVSFKTTYDDRGRISGALFAAVDVTNFMNVMDKYEGLLRRYDNNVADNRSAFRINLSENKLLACSLNNGLPQVPSSVKTGDEFFMFLLENISAPDERMADLKDTLTVKNAIDRLDIGTEVIEEELFIRLDTDDSEWHMLKMFLAVNPETNDKELIAFFRNIHAERTSQMIIDGFIKYEYELLAVLDTTKEAIKFIQEKTPKYITNTNDTYDFTNFLYDYLPDYVVENELQECAYTMDIHSIVKELSKNNIYSLSVSVYENNGEQVEIRRKRYQYKYIDDSKRYVAITRTDITDQYKSEFDSVSGIYNRNSFYKRTKNLIMSNPRTSYVIVRWDIDKFKLYNDTFGTDAGDELLAMIGNSYRELLSDDLIIANLGADNFAICMPSNKFDPDEQQAFIANLFSSFSQNFTLTYHMAAYRITDTSLDISIMCDRAAIAVKSIKEQVSTRFIWYDDNMLKNAVREQELISEIRRALDNNEFCLYVQPQYNQITEKLIGGEVLVRWKKQDGTIVTPGEFVPVMERSGLISRLDEFIWNQTAKYLSNRIKNKQNIVPLAVNISRRDFYNPRFCEIFYNLTEKYGILPEHLDLEVTESAYIENADLIIGIINELRSRGFKIKMDDFGSGYSSLNTLKTVPVDTIKLDMQFITLDDGDETSNFRGGVILDSVLRMAHWLGLPVIAEGVETRKQAEFLKSIDCAIIQGFYFSKPLPLDEFSALLDNSVPEYNDSKALDVNSEFDNYDFWDPTSYSAILFNSFIGPAAIFECYGNNISPLRINDLFFKEIGVTPNEYNYFNADFKKLIYKDDYDKFLDCLKEIALTTEELQYEFRWYTPSSPKPEAYIWVRLRIRRIAHNDQRFVAFVNLENITERKALEIRDTILANRLSNFIETIPNGIFAFEISDSIEITYMNSKLYSIFGYTKGDVEDEKNFNPILDVHPDDRDIVFDAIWSDSMADDSQNLNIRHHCKDGTYKSVNMRIIKPTFTNESTIGYAIISEESDSLKNLYEIEAIASHSDRLISRFDLQNGRLIHYFQFSDYFDLPDDALAETLDDISKYGIIKAELDNATFHEGLKQGKSQDTIILYMREKNKEYAPYLCKTTLVKDSSGVPIFAIMSLQKSNGENE